MFFVKLRPLLLLLLALLVLLLLVVTLPDRANIAKSNCTRLPATSRDLSSSPHSAPELNRCAQHAHFFVYMSNYELHAGRQPLQATSITTA